MRVNKEAPSKADPTESLLRVANSYGKQLRARVGAMSPEEREAWARETLGEKAEATMSSDATIDPTQETDSGIVRCLNGCGVLDVCSGGVCPFCGGMVLSEEALERARRLADQWEVQDEGGETRFPEPRGKP